MIFETTFKRQPTAAERQTAAHVAHEIAEIMGQLRVGFDRAFALAFRAPVGSNWWRIVRYQIEDAGQGHGLHTQIGVRKAATKLGKLARKADRVKEESLPATKLINFNDLFGDVL